ncbi:hypothetical protein [Lapidilactobacillus wuchangensis]|uniref:hypothetical protein n=1 Tax=Lapidilactobacillus wuchangensis TaxID=2486001 RepID=UPI000F775080|nr:hypothetical protein [Lapidilactobacillus wuchangensis]
MTSLITVTMIVLLLLAIGAMIGAGIQAHHQKRQLARVYLLLATTLTGIGILLGSIQPAQPVIFVASLVLILASLFQLIFLLQQFLKSVIPNKQVSWDKTEK